MSVPNPSPKPCQKVDKGSAAQQASGFFRNFANPVYHLTKLRQDFAAARHALQIWHLSEVVHDAPVLERAIRGKMFATFVIAGLISIVALPIGAAVQVATLNAWWGLIATILIGHFTANAGFQVIWSVTNRDLYRHWPSAWERFLALQHDLLPMQVQGLKIVAYILVVALPFNATLAMAVQHWVPGAVKVVPVNILSALVDAALFNSTFVRLMGNLFERHATVLTGYYLAEFGPNE